jgi:5-methyltetrahydrofolate--homocysteine methyltransferase
MLNEFVAKKLVKLNAVVGLYPANANGDDIEVYTDETRSTVKAKLHGLRQQVGRVSGNFIQGALMASPLFLWASPLL